MMLRKLNSTAGGSHRQRLWIPLLIAFVALCGFLLSLAHPERAETHPSAVEAASTPLASTANLEVVQSSRQTVFAGDKMTYTVVVINKGTSAVSDVALVDTWTTKMYQTLSTLWPYGVLAVFEDYRVSPPGAVTTFTHQINNANRRGEATWWLAPIAAGDSVEIVFTVTVPITLQPTLDSYVAAPLPVRRIGPSTVENAILASVGGERFDGNLATAQVVAPLLLLTQSASGETLASVNQARVGRLLTYTLEVENVLREGTLARPDGWPAANLVITERLAPEVRGAWLATTASVPDVTATYTESSGTLVWKFDPTFVLTRGEKISLTYTVRVPANVAYNPPTKYLTVLNSDVRARAAFMPFREATLRANHLVKLFGPFEKTVATLSPPKGAAATFANRPITYTLMYYNPISVTGGITFADKMHHTFVFSHTAGGYLPAPTVNGSQLLWKNVEVPGYAVISATFVVTVSTETPIKMGGATCSALNYFNAVTATSSLFPVPAYVGDNKNQLAVLTVEPQLLLTKIAVPTKQYPGQNVVYTIKLENKGNVPIPPPIIVTDTLPAGFVYVKMVGSGPPGEPVIDGNTLVWTNIPTITANASFLFSFEVQVDGPVNAKFKNKVIVSAPDVSSCQIESAEVTLLSPFNIDKMAEGWEGNTIEIGSALFPLVRQDELVTYTASITNISPRTAYTLTQFRDILDSATVTNKDRTGLINPLNRTLEYTYMLPTPVVLYPEDSWEHVFTATMKGFGTGTAWCDDKEQINNAKVEQRIQAVEFTLEEDVTFNTKTLAPIYVLPHVSMFQQAYPNPVAIGELVTVVLTLRDNRSAPITPVTGINLQWNLPLDFSLIDTDPITSSSNATSAAWVNVDLPLGGEREFIIRIRAPRIKQDGWSRSYNATAQVNSLDNPSICIPKSTRFVKSKSGDIGPDHALGLPGPIPELNDQSFVSLIVNQGLEMNKVPNLKEIGPYGVIEYKITVKNLTGAPVSSIVITDILPYLPPHIDTTSWEYLETVIGIEPHNEKPLIWHIGGIEAQKEAIVVIKTRASSWLGTALNHIGGSAPINIGYNTKYTTNLPVQVVSGIGFYKTVAPNSILAGAATTYTIRFYNGATYDIQYVVITDTLPPGFSFEAMVSPALAPVIEGQQLIWTVPTKIAKNGGTYEIIFRARTKTEAQGMFTGKYYNDVIASAKKADTGDLVEVPPTGLTAPVQVEGLPTVEVHKTARPNTVAPGQEVVYDISLYNEAPATRTLQITDTLPAHFRLVKLIAPMQAITSYVGSQERIVWQNIPINGQSWVTLTFRAQVAAEAPPGRYGNVVQVQIDAFALPPSTPMANVWVVELPRTDVKISKTDGSLVAEKGAPINYTIVYTNASPDAITFETVVLTETISPPPPYVTVGAGWEDRGNGRFRRIIDSPLNPGASNTVQFSIQLAEDIPDEFQWLHNQVEIGYTTAEQVVENTPKDNVAEDWSLISGGESIVALKQADYAGDILLAGQEVTYTISILNTETQAHTLRVTDTLPVSFTFSAPVSPPHIEMTQLVDGHWQVVWDGINAPAQTFTVIVFRARVDPLAGAATACNVVQMERGDGLALPPTEPQACVVVQPLQRVDAYVNKSDSKDSAKANDVLHYSIQYGNAAASQTALQTIVLTETVSPPEVIGAMLSGWEKLGNGQYRITLPGLSPGQTGEIIFSIRLVNPIPETITMIHNQAEIGYTTAEPAVEVNRFDNIGADVTVVQHDPNDVIASKSATVAINPARPNDFVTYTISLRNDTANIYTARITDTLPPYFSFAQAVYPTTGYTTLWDGGVQLVVWETTIPPGTASLIFRAQVAANAPTGRYYNAVQVQRNEVVQSKVTSLAPVDVVSGLKIVDAQVTKSDGRASALAGETLTYTITYANAATSGLAFQTVILTETISPSDYLTVPNPDGWTNLGGGRYTREIVGTLTPGVTRNVQFIVQLNAELPDTVTAVTNTVEIGYTTSEPVAEPNVANNTYTDVTLVGSNVPPERKIYLPLILRKR